MGTSCDGSPRDRARGLGVLGQRRALVRQGSQPGAHCARSRVGLPDAVRRDIDLAREAGLDLVAVKGHIARPELYDAADEPRHLVWQDFPLHGGHARSVRRQAVEQARAAVDVLGHHPSIAVWCGHDTPEDRFIGQQLPTWNRTILDRWVKRAFEKADETRPVIAHSGVMPHLPQLEGTDIRLHLGWGRGNERDLPGLAAAMPRLVRFVSEFGSQSVPTVIRWSRSIGGPTSTGTSSRSVMAWTATPWCDTSTPPSTRRTTIGAGPRSSTRRRCCGTTSRRCVG